jgi:hypothetical protein
LLGLWSSSILRVDKVIALSRDFQKTKVRIFLASSVELIEERSGFAQMLTALNARPDLQRSYLLQPVRWEADAFGADSSDIDQTIKRSTDFETLHIVVVIVWNKIGEGTRGEYELARRLWSLRKRPRLLVFARTPSPTTNPEALQGVRQFKERLIAAGVLPNEYTSPKEFFSRLAEQLPTLLPRPELRERTSLANIRRSFVRWAAINSSLAIGAVVLCRLMNFPDTWVSLLTILVILAAPIVLFVGSLIVLWYYHRLLALLRDLWFSPDFTDQALYDAFRNVIPRFATPVQLHKQFPRSPVSVLFTLVLLFFIFFLPVVGQYQCLFEEILTWEYAVSHEVVRGSDGLPVVDAQGNVESRYVDRRRAWWPFRLQDQTVRQYHEQEDGPIYVHARGKFFLDTRQLPPLAERFRGNLGPEVFLPWQPWSYLGLLLATGGLGLWTLLRLGRFRREFTMQEGKMIPLEWEWIGDTAIPVLISDSKEGVRRK